MVLLNGVFLMKFDCSAFYERPSRDPQRHISAVLQAGQKSASCYPSQARVGCIRALVPLAKFLSRAKHRGSVGQEQLSLFLRGIRKLREAQAASEVVLAPQQHEQTSSVSSCFEELVTGPCAMIECRGQIRLSYLCKEGSGKPARTMPLYRLS